MQTQWGALLAVEKAAGRGGIMWPEAIVRGLPFIFQLAVPMDLTGYALKMGFAVAPDAAPLLTVSATMGTFDAGITPVTIGLTTANVATIGTAQVDGDGDGLAEVLADLLAQADPPSGDWRRWMLVSVPITGKITNA